MSDAIREIGLYTFMNFVSLFRVIYDNESTCTRMVVSGL